MLNCARPAASRQPHDIGLSISSHTEIDFAAMPAKNSVAPRSHGWPCQGPRGHQGVFARHSALTLSEIAASARMPAATARRCLLTLEELGYVTRRGRAFLLRPKVLELGAAYLESMDIEHLTKTHLEELARVTGDSAALSVLDGNDIVYVARTSVRTLVRLEAHVGSRFPAHVTSMGRVLLAGVGPSTSTSTSARRSSSR